MTFRICSFTRDLGRQAHAAFPPPHPPHFPSSPSSWDGWTLCMLVRHSTADHTPVQRSIHEVMRHHTPKLRTATVHLLSPVHRSPWTDSLPLSSGCMLSSASPHPLTPCTQRQPDRGRAGRGGVPAGAGPGQQSSAAAGLHLRFSRPTAHTPARSGWTQQRGGSLSELPGCGGNRVDFILLIHGELWPTVSHDMTPFLSCWRHVSNSQHNLKMALNF